MLPRDGSPPLKAEPNHYLQIACQRTGCWSGLSAN